MTRHTVWILLFAVLYAALPSCGKEPPPAQVVGSFSYYRPARSFLHEQEGVRFIHEEGDEPRVTSITTNMSHKGSGGGRLAFAGTHDFDMEIRMEDIPAESYLLTGFGIPIKDTFLRESLTAAYEIIVNGKCVRRKNISDFRDRKNQVWFDEKVDLTGLPGGRATILFKSEVKPEAEGISRGWSEPRLMTRVERPWTDASPERPNIILLLVDTLRADHLSCYGYPRKTSPRLDDFAARSLLFEDVIAPSSWTWPSTASVLTGLYPLHHGVVDAARSTLAQENKTLAEIGVEEGARTAAFITNPLINKAKNFDQGFVDFFTMHWADAKQVVDRFTQWLQTVKEGRFIAYLHFIDPHGPYAPPDEYIARFSDPRDADRIPEKELKSLRHELGTLKKRPGERDRLAVRNAMDRYDSEILFWDEQFGRLLDFLEAEGLAQNTLIAVTADHGEEFLEHGLLGHGWTLYDISLRVPFVLGGPGITPGRYEDQVELISCLPTLLEAGGLDADGALFDGPSLLAGTKPARGGAAYTHTEHAFSPDLMRRSGLYAVRTEKWKLIYDPHSKRMELYDLDGDEEEKTDLAADPSFAEVRRKLTHAVEQWIAKYKDAAPMRGLDVDDETLKAFEQLGYLGY